MEMFQGLDVAAVGHPSLTAIVKGGDKDSMVDTDLCMEMKILVLKDPATESPKNCWCLFDSVLNLIMDNGIFRENASQVSERRDYRELIVVSSEVW